MHFHCFRLEVAKLLSIHYSNHQILNYLIFADPHRSPPWGHIPKNHFDFQFNFPRWNCLNPYCYSALCFNRLGRQLSNS